MSRVVVVGTGTGGAQLALALRKLGHAGSITLVGDEPGIPYQRPPLSKGYLKTGDESQLTLRPEAFWARNGIDVLGGERVVAIDRDRATVELSRGERLGYDHLVLATGARNRSLPGADHALGLRTFADARRLRARLAAGSRVAIVGGGFIGLEVAAAARAVGAEVTVLDTAEQLLSRVVSAPVAAFFRALHERHGVRVLTSSGVADVTAGAIARDGGDPVPADVVVVGIGVVPNVELARAAGLAVDDGVLVDDRLLTSDPRISALGDCARFSCAVSGLTQRLESIQAATDHARCVAGRLLGQDAPYRRVPWFWTEQYDQRLQIAGVAPPDALTVVRGDPERGAFSVCRFGAGGLLAVESVNAAADHMAARKLIGTPAAARLRPEQVADPAVALKTLLRD